MSLRRLHPGPNQDLTGRRSLRTQRSAVPTVTTHTVSSAAAIILSRRSRWEWPEAPPIWDRSPLIHSIASRTTAPVRSACPIGIEGRVSLVSKALGGPGRLELQFFKSGTPYCLCPKSEVQWPDAVKVENPVQRSPKRQWPARAPGLARTSPGARGIGVLAQKVAQKRS